MTIRNRTKIITLACAISGTVLSALIWASHTAIERHKSSVYNPTDYPAKHSSVLLVLGGGIDKARGEPKPTLQKRLDTAAELFKIGEFETILVSGDNRFIDYNEPKVMKNYLIKAGIPAERIQEDFAGRSTYESC